MATVSATPIPEVSTANLTCAGCAVELPLSSPVGLSEPATWICAGCGTSVVACADADLLPEFGSLVKLHDQHFDTSHSHGIPAHIRVHLASIANRAVPQDVINRRRSARVHNPLMISAIELDHQFSPQGDAINVIMTDVSREGIGLALTDGTTAPLLALQFPPRDGEQIQVIARVVRQQALIPPYAAVGCEFTCRLGS